MSAEVLQADGTPLLLAQLVESPDAVVNCVFGSARSDRPVAPAVDVWFMPQGCLSLNSGSVGNFREGVAGFSVQALCLHHTISQTPGVEGGWSPDPTDPRFLRAGAHLLVDLAARQPELGIDPQLNEPALRIPYTMNDLRTFAAGTELGRLVFLGNAHLLG